MNNNYCCVIGKMALCDMFVLNRVQYFHNALILSELLVRQAFASFVNLTIILSIICNNVLQKTKKSFFLNKKTLPTFLLKMSFHTQIKNIVINFCNIYRVKSINHTLFFFNQIIFKPF